MFHSVSSVFFISFSSFTACCSVEQGMWWRTPSSLCFHAKLKEPQSPYHSGSFNKDFASKPLQLALIWFFVPLCRVKQSYIMIRQWRKTDKRADWLWSHWKTRIRQETSQEHLYINYVNTEIHNFWPWCREYLVVVLHNVGPALFPVVSVF